MSDWKLVWTEAAKKDLKKLDGYVMRVIITKTSSSLENVKDPRRVLIPLKYGKKGQYKYKIGSYRVICRILDNECVVEAITVGHRKQVYK